MADPAPERLQLLRLADVCRLLRVHRSTIWRLIQAGEFPAGCRIRGLLLWRASDVAAWQAERFGGGK
jgi:excisionase family DNA binding protein